MEQMIGKKARIRLMAFLMAVVLLAGMLPVSTLNVRAETDCITITVSSGDGNGLEGAEVSYTFSSSDTDTPDISSSIQTNNDGVAEITGLPNVGSGNWMLSATISKMGYLTDTTTISNKPVTSGRQNFDVILEKENTVIEDIQIAALNSVYEKGIKQELVTEVQGSRAGDIIFYSVDKNTWSEVVPTEENAGEYSVYVKITREGCNDYESGELKAIIEKANITNVVVTEYNEAYDGEEHAAFQIEGLENGDRVTTTYNGVDTTFVYSGEDSIDLPKFENVGSYAVILKIERDNNYNVFQQTYTTEIRACEIEGISASLNTGLKFNGKELELLKEISGTVEGDKVFYSVNGGGWVELTENQRPTAVDAGEYTVGIKVNRENYEEKEIELNPATVTVEKADQIIRFIRENIEETVSLAAEPANNVYDFAAEGEAVGIPVITYSVENASEDGMDVSEIAEIISTGNNAGQLTVLRAGNITITATIAGDNNYKEGTVSHNLTILNTEDDLIVFKDNTLDFVIGTQEAVPQQLAERKYADDNGQIAYYVEVLGLDAQPDAVGIEIDPNGKVSVTDLNALAGAIEATGGKLSIKIRAEKGTGTKTAWERENIVYGNGKASYIIHITAEEFPETIIPYTIRDTSGNIIDKANGKNGWYNTAVTVIPAEGYVIARDDITSEYSDSVVFGETVQDQGMNTRIIYLKNKDTGAVTVPITIGVEKLDSVKPDMMAIQFPETIERDGIKYYDEEITIIFTAYDKASGVDSFEWSYTRSEGAGADILDADGGEILSAVQDEDDPTIYTAELKLPGEEAQQLKGNLTVWAIDTAGNKSDALKDNGTFVIDSISPAQKVSFGLAAEGGNFQVVDSTHYFSGAVEFTFDIVEANFFPEDVVITVSKDSGAGVRVQGLDWAKTGKQNDYEAKLTLSDDGAYVVEMSYTDRSGQKMESYQSNVIVVDNTVPVIGFEYMDYNNAQNPQTAVVTITEHNFRQSDIKISTRAMTVTGDQADTKAMNLQEYLRNCEWVDDGDTHTALVSEEFVDAIYELTINYKDLALNPAKQLVSSQFIVDHTAPETMSVSYSEPVNSVSDTILSVVTFGYYNPGVTVTFTAHDTVAGVDHFTWEYIREYGASAGNVEEHEAMDLSAVQDPVDGSKYTASITLPKEQSEQLRGHIAFTATDRNGNVSDKYEDNSHIVIVDTVSPTMTVEYSAPDNIFDGKVYYHQDITVDFIVTESNFYSEDIEIKLSKNGGAEMEVTPVWVDHSADVHVGSYTIEAPADHSGDGDYVFTVAYTDRSNNIMSAYTSGILVVDTIVPVIQVEYGDQSPINILADSSGNERKYFASVQTARIMITEHNFNPEEIEYMIIAQDAAGRELDADSLHEKSSWVSEGDNHVLTITFPGDANYTFGIGYTDLAKLAAVQYEAEYFTVDTTAPAELGVSYSTSVLDTILSTVTFGFYNAKMTVTITAADEISGVYHFKYSYLNAAGVSAVNAQLVEETMEMDSITYSEDNITATAVFEIPKQELGVNSQFNGTVSFNAADRSGNESDFTQDSKRIVVDNIAPTADVQYNAPVQVLDNISYYDGEINATVTINEANFYPEDVTVSVAKDGEAYVVSPVWVDNNTDIHIGTFTLADDGDYIVDIACTDKSGNVMQQYTSEQMTIDTDIVPAQITINGQEADGKAFKGDVVPAVSFSDKNFHSYEIRLTRTRYGDKNVDVTEQFIAGHITLDGTGGFGMFDTFEKLQENDGIYTITVSLNDKAGHTVEKTATFTVNRYGSVYEYSDYLVSLIQNGGAYVQQINENLVITEYNADRLVNGYLNIEISRDGKPLETSEYDVSPEINGSAAAGSSGWYQYQYTISKENFSRDGIYKISISSKDATGNTPENTNYEDRGILFRVDSTPPEIGSITGLEESVINATNVEVKYTVYDTIGLESVTAYVNGNEYERVTDFAGDLNNYSGSLTLAESSSEQTVRLVVKDLAGNVTDTNSNGFSSAYAFHRSITVSTNAFVRWVANRQLFWGSIAGVGVTAMGISGLTILLKRRMAAKAFRA